MINLLKTEIVKKQAEEAKINALKKEMEEQGLGIHESEGVNTRILGLVGDTSVVDMRHIIYHLFTEDNSILHYM